MRKIMNIIKNRLAFIAKVDEDFYEQEYKYFAIFLTAFLVGIFTCIFNRDFLLMLYLFIFFVMFLLYEYYRLKISLNCYNITARCTAREKGQTLKGKIKKGGRHQCVFESVDTPGLFFEMLIPKKSPIAPGNDVKLMFIRSECNQLSQDTIRINTCLLLKVLKKNGASFFINEK